MTVEKVRIFLFSLLWVGQRGISTADEARIQGGWAGQGRGRQHQSDCPGDEERPRGVSSFSVVLVWGLSRDELAAGADTLPYPSTLRVRIMTEVHPFGLKGALVVYPTMAGF